MKNRNKYVRYARVSLMRMFRNKLVRKTLALWCAFATLATTCAPAWAASGTYFDGAAVLDRTSASVSEMSGTTSTYAGFTAGGGVGVLDWQKLNVPGGATLEFNNGTFYNVVNSGGKMSQIEGMISGTGNANVNIFNPNGVLIANGAQISVEGIFGAFGFGVSASDLNNWIANPSALPAAVAGSANAAMSGDVTVKGGATISASQIALAGANVKTENGAAFNGAATIAAGDYIKIDNIAGGSVSFQIPEAAQGGDADILGAFAKSLTVKAAGDVTVANGTLSAGEGVEITTAGDPDVALGDFAANNANISVAAGHDFTVKAAGEVNVLGNTTIAANNVTIQANDGNLAVRGANDGAASVTIDATSKATFTAANGKVELGSEANDQRVAVNAAAMDITAKSAQLYNQAQQGGVIKADKVTLQGSMTQAAGAKIVTDELVVDNAAKTGDFTLKGTANEIAVAGGAAKNLELVTKSVSMKATDVAGNLTIEAKDGAIAQTGAIKAGGVTSLKATDAVTLENADNEFAGKVGLDAGAAAALTAKSALDFSSIKAGDDLTAKAKGDIKIGSGSHTVGGNLVATGLGDKDISIADGSLAVGGNVTLTTAGNPLIRLGDVVINNAQVTADGNITANAAGEIAVLGTAKVEGANVALTAVDGNIDVLGANAGAAKATVKATADDGAVTLTAVNGAVTVGNEANNMQAAIAADKFNITAGEATLVDQTQQGGVIKADKVTVQGSMTQATGAKMVVGELVVDNAAKTGDFALKGTANEITVAGGAAKNLDLVTKSVSLKATETADKLTINATGGNVAQTGAITVGGKADVTATGNVVLDNANNDFLGKVNAAATDVAITGKDLVNLDQVTASGALAVNGKDVLIDQTAVVSAGSATLAATRNLLANGNAEVTVANDLVMTADHAVDIRGNGGTIKVKAGTVGITATEGLVIQDTTVESTVGGVTATAKGTVSENGVIVDSATVKGKTDVTLVAEKGDVELNGTALVKSAGTVNATAAAGAITEESTAKIEADGVATFAAKEIQLGTKLERESGEVTLAKQSPIANSFGGKVNATATAGDVVIDAASDIDVGKVAAKSGDTVVGDVSINAGKNLLIGDTGVESVHGDNVMLYAGSKELAGEGTIVIDHGAKVTAEKTLSATANEGVNVYGATTVVEAKGTDDALAIVAKQGDIEVAGATVKAAQDNLVLDSVVESVMIKDNATVKAGSFTVNADGSVVSTAPGTIYIFSGKDITISGGAQVAANGTDADSAVNVYAHNDIMVTDAGTKVVGDKRVNISAYGEVKVQKGGYVAGNSMVLVEGGNVTIGGTDAATAGGAVEAKGRVFVGAMDTVTVNGGAKIGSSESVRVEGDNVTIAKDGLVIAAKNATVAAGDATIGGTVRADDGSVYVKADNDVTLTSTSKLHAKGTDGNVLVDADHDLTASGTLKAEGTSDDGVVALKVGNQADLTGMTVEAKTLALKTAGETTSLTLKGNAAITLDAGEKDVTINHSAGTLTIVKGEAAAGAKVNEVEGEASFTVHSLSDYGASGPGLVGKDVTVNGTDGSSLTVAAGAILWAKGDAAVAIDGSVNNLGSVELAKVGIFTAGGNIVNNASWLAHDEMTLTAGGDITDGATAAMTVEKGLATFNAANGKVELDSVNNDYQMNAKVGATAKNITLVAKDGIKLAKVNLTDDDGVLDVTAKAGNIQQLEGDAGGITAAGVAKFTTDAGNVVVGNGNNDFQSKVNAKATAGNILLADKNTIRLGEVEATKVGDNGGDVTVMAGENVRLSDDATSLKAVAAELYAGVGYDFGSIQIEKGAKVTVGSQLIAQALDDIFVLDGAQVVANGEGDALTMYAEKGGIYVKGDNVAPGSTLIKTTAGNLALHAAEGMDIAKGAVLDAAKVLTATADNAATLNAGLTVRDAGTVVKADDVELTAHQGGVMLKDGAKVQAEKNVTVKTEEGRATVRGGALVDAKKDVVFNVNQFMMKDGTLQAVDNVDVNASGKITVDSAAAQFTAGKYVTIDGKDDIEIKSVATMAAPNVRIANEDAMTAKDVTISGNVTAEGNLTVIAKNNVNQNANLATQNGSVYVEAKDGDILMNAGTETAAAGSKDKPVSGNVLYKTTSGDIKGVGGNARLESVNGMVKLQSKDGAIGENIQIKAPVFLAETTDAGSTIHGNLEGDVKVAYKTPGNVDITHKDGTLTIADASLLGSLYVNKVLQTFAIKEIELQDVATATKGITAGGNVTIAGVNDHLTQAASAEINVAGETTLSAIKGATDDGNIVLDSMGNDFQNKVNVVSAENVTLRDKDALRLGNITVNETLTANAANVRVDEEVTVKAKGTSVAADDAAIALNATENVLIHKGSVVADNGKLVAKAGQSVDVRAELGGPTAVTAAKGAVELEGGVAVTVANGATVNATEGDVTLLAKSAGSGAAGGVTVNGGHVTAAQMLTAKAEKGNVTLAGALEAGTVKATDVALVAENGDIAIKDAATATADGTFSATAANGDITEADTAAILVKGEATLKAMDIDAKSMLNDFAKDGGADLAKVNAEATAGNIVLGDKNNIRLGKIKATEKVTVKAVKDIQLTDADSSVTAKNAELNAGYGLDSGSVKISDGAKVTIGSMFLAMALDNVEIFDGADVKVTGADLDPTDDYAIGLVAARGSVVIDGERAGAVTVKAGTDTQAANLAIEAGEGVIVAAGANVEATRDIAIAANDISAGQGVTVRDANTLVKAGRNATVVAGDGIQVNTGAKVLAANDLTIKTTGAGAHAGDVVVNNATVKAGSFNEETGAFGPSDPKGKLVVNSSKSVTIENAAKVGANNGVDIDAAANVTIQNANTKLASGTTMTIDAPTAVTVKDGAYIAANETIMVGATTRPTVATVNNATIEAKKDVGIAGNDVVIQNNAKVGSSLNTYLYAMHDITVESGAKVLADQSSDHVAELYAENNVVVQGENTLVKGDRTMVYGVENVTVQDKATVSSTSLTDHPAGYNNIVVSADNGNTVVDNATVDAAYVAEVSSRYGDVTIRNGALVKGDVVYVDGGFDDTATHGSVLVDNATVQGDSFVELYAPTESATVRNGAQVLLNGLATGEAEIEITAKNILVDNAKIKAGEFNETTGEPGSKFGTIGFYDATSVTLQNAAKVGANGAIEMFAKDTLVKDAGTQLAASGAMTFDTLADGVGTVTIKDGAYVGGKSTITVGGTAKANELTVDGASLVAEKDVTLNAGGQTTLKGGAKVGSDKNVVLNVDKLTVNEATLIAKNNVDVNASGKILVNSDAAQFTAGEYVTIDGKDDVEIMAAAPMQAANVRIANEDAATAKNVTIGGDVVADGNLTIIASGTVNQNANLTAKKGSAYVEAKAGDILIAADKTTKVFGSKDKPVSGNVLYKTTTGDIRGLDDDHNARLESDQGMVKIESKTGNIGENIQVKAPVFFAETTSADSTIKGNLEGDVKVAYKTPGNVDITHKDGTLTIADASLLGSLYVNKVLQTFAIKEVELQNAATATKGITAGGNVTIAGVNDRIVQEASAMVDIGKVTTLSATAGADRDGDIILANAGNDFKGKVHATGENISLRDQNTLNLGDVAAAKTLQATGKDIVVDKGATVTAAETATFDATRNVVVSKATVTAGGELTANAGHEVDIRGELGATAVKSVTGNITLNGDSAVSVMDGASVQAVVGDVTLHAGAVAAAGVTVDGGHVQAAKTVTMLADQSDVMIAGAISAGTVEGKDIAITATTGDILLKDAATVTAAGKLDAKAEQGYIVEEDTAALLVTAEANFKAMDIDVKSMLNDFAKDGDVNLAKVNAEATAGNIILGEKNNIRLGKIKATGDVKVNAGENLLVSDGDSSIIAENAYLYAGVEAVDGSPVDWADSGSLKIDKGATVTIGSKFIAMAVDDLFVLDGAQVQAKGADTALILGTYKGGVYVNGDNTAAGSTVVRTTQGDLVIQAGEGVEIAKGALVDAAHDLTVVADTMGTLKAGVTVRDENTLVTAGNNAILEAMKGSVTVEEKATVQADKFVGLSANENVKVQTGAKVKAGEFNETTYVTEGEIGNMIVEAGKAVTIQSAAKVGANGTVAIAAGTEVTVQDENTQVGAKGALSLDAVDAVKVLNKSVVASETTITVGGMTKANELTIDNAVVEAKNGVTLNADGMTTLKGGAKVGAGTSGAADADVVLNVKKLTMNDATLIASRNVDVNASDKVTVDSDAAQFTAGEYVTIDGKDDVEIKAAAPMQAANVRIANEDAATAKDVTIGGDVVADGNLTIIASGTVNQNANLTAKKGSAYVEAKAGDILIAADKTTKVFGSKDKPVSGNVLYKTTTGDIKGVGGNARLESDQGMVKIMSESGNIGENIQIKAPVFLAETTSADSTIKGNLEGDVKVAYKTPGNVDITHKDGTLTIADASLFGSLYVNKVLQTFAIDEVELQNAATATKGITAGGNVTIAGVNDRIVQEASAMVDIGKVTTLSATAGADGDGNIVLANAGNDFKGKVNVVSAENAELTDANTLELDQVEVNKTLVAKATTVHADEDAVVTAKGEGLATGDKAITFNATENVVIERGKVTAENGDIAFTAGHNVDVRADVGGPTAVTAAKGDIAFTADERVSIANGAKVSATEGNITLKSQSATAKGIVVDNGAQVVAAKTIAMTADKGGIKIADALGTDATLVRAKDIEMVAVDDGIKVLDAASISAGGELTMKAEQGKIVEDDAAKIEVVKKATFLAKDINVKSMLNDFAKDGATDLAKVDAEATAGNIVLGEKNTIRLGKVKATGDVTVNAGEDIRLSDADTSLESANANLYAGVKASGGVPTDWTDHGSVQIEKGATVTIGSQFLATALDNVEIFDGAVVTANGAGDALTLNAARGSVVIDGERAGLATVKATVGNMALMAGEGVEIKQGALVDAAETLTVRADDNTAYQGVIIRDANTLVKAKYVNISSADDVTVKDSAIVMAGDIDPVTPAFGTKEGNLKVVADNGSVTVKSGAQVGANGTVDVDAAKDITVDNAKLVANEEMTLDAVANVTVKNGAYVAGNETITVGGDTAPAKLTVDNATVAAKGNLDATAGAIAVQQNAKVGTDAAATLTATDADGIQVNTGARVLAANDLTLKTTGAGAHAGDVVVNNATVKAGSFDEETGVFGPADPKGMLVVNSSKSVTIENAAKVGANNGVDIDAAANVTIQNANTKLVSGTTMTIDAPTAVMIKDGAYVAANETITVGDTTAPAKLSVDNATVAAKGNLDASAGAIAIKNAAKVGTDAAATLTATDDDGIQVNTGAKVLAANDLTLKTTGAGAHAGDVVVNNATVKAGSFDEETGAFGPTDPKGKLVVNSSKSVTIENAAKVGANNGVDVDAAANVTIQNANTKLASGTTMTIDAPTAVTIKDGAYVAANETITVGDTTAPAKLTVDNATVAAKGNLDATAGAIAIQQNAKVGTDAAATLTATDADGIQVNTGAKVLAANDLTIKTTGAGAHAGDVVVNNATVKAGSFDEETGAFGPADPKGRLVVNSSKSVTIENAAKVGANNGVDIDAAANVTIQNANTKLVSGTTMMIDAPTAVTIKDGAYVAANETITVGGTTKANELTVDGASLVAEKDVTLNATTFTAENDAKVASDQSVIVNVKDINVKTAANLLADVDVVLNTSDKVTINEANIKAGRNVDVNADGKILVDSADAKFTAGAFVTIDGKDDVEIKAAAPMAAENVRIANEAAPETKVVTIGGDVVAEGNLTVAAIGDIRQNANLTANKGTLLVESQKGDIVLKAGVVSETKGSIADDANIVYWTHTTDPAKGRIYGDGGDATMKTADGVVVVKSEAGHIGEYIQVETPVLIIESKKGTIKGDLIGDVKVAYLSEEGDVDITHRDGTLTVINAKEDYGTIWAQRVKSEPIVNITAEDPNPERVNVWDTGVNVEGISAKNVTIAGVNDNITQNANAKIIATETTTLSATAGAKGNGDIILESVLNDFQGVVNVTADGNVSLVDANDIILGQFAVNKNLTVETVNGDITTVQNTTIAPKSVITAGEKITLTANKSGSIELVKGATVTASEIEATAAKRSILVYEGTKVTATGTDDALKLTAGQRVDVGDVDTVVKATTGNVVIDGTEGARVKASALVEATAGAVTVRSSSTTSGTGITIDSATVKGKTDVTLLAADKGDIKIEGTALVKSEGTLNATAANGNITETDDATIFARGVANLAAKKNILTASALNDFYAKVNAMSAEGDITIRDANDIQLGKVRAENGKATVYSKTGAVKAGKDLGTGLPGDVTADILAKNVELNGEGNDVEVTGGGKVVATEKLLLVADEEVLVSDAGTSLSAYDVEFKSGVANDEGSVKIRDAAAVAAGSKFLADALDNVEIFDSATVNVTGTGLDPLTENAITLNAQRGSVRVDGDRSGAATVKAGSDMQKANVRLEAGEGVVIAAGANVEATRDITIKANDTLSYEGVRIRDANTVVKAGDNVTITSVDGVLLGGGARVESVEADVVMKATDLVVNKANLVAKNNIDVDMTDTITVDDAEANFKAGKYLWLDALGSIAVKNAGRMDAANVRIANEYATSAKDVTISGDVTASGNLTIIAKGSVEQNANLKAEHGSVYVSAKTGHIALGNDVETKAYGPKESTDNGNVLYETFTSDGWIKGLSLAHKASMYSEKGVVALKAQGGEIGDNIKVTSALLLGLSDGTIKGALEGDIHVAYKTSADVDITHENGKLTIADASTFGTLCANKVETTETTTEVLIQEASTATHGITAQNVTIKGENDTITQDIAGELGATTSASIDAAKVTTLVSSGTIDLRSMENDFHGDVNVKTTTGDATINDANDLNFKTVSVGGNLNATAGRDMLMDNTDSIVAGGTVHLIAERDTKIADHATITAGDTVFLEGTEATHGQISITTTGDADQNAIVANGEKVKILNRNGGVSLGTSARETGTTAETMGKIEATAGHIIIDATEDIYVNAEEFTAARNIHIANQVADGTAPLAAGEGHDILIESKLLAKGYLPEPHDPELPVSKIEGNMSIKASKNVLINSDIETEGGTIYLQAARDGDLNVGSIYLGATEGTTPNKVISRGVDGNVFMIAEADDANIIGAKIDSKTWEASEVPDGWTPVSVQAWGESWEDPLSGELYGNYNGWVNMQTTGSAGSDMDIIGAHAGVKSKGNVKMKIKGDVVLSIQAAGDIQVTHKGDTGSITVPDGKSSYGTGNANEVLSDFRDKVEDGGVVRKAIDGELLPGGHEMKDSGKGWSAGKDIIVRAEGDVDFHVDGQMEAGRDIDLKIGGDLDSKPESEITAGRNIDMVIDGDKTIRGLMTAGWDINETVVGNVTVFGEINAGHDVNELVGRNLSTPGGVIGFGNELKIETLSTTAPINIIPGRFIDVKSGDKGVAFKTLGGNDHPEVVDNGFGNYVLVDGRIVGANDQRHAELAAYESSAADGIIRLTPVFTYMANIFPLTEFTDVQSQGATITQGNMTSDKGDAKDMNEGKGEGESEGEKSAEASEEETEADENQVAKK